MRSLYTIALVTTALLLSSARAIPTDELSLRVHASPRKDQVTEMFLSRLDYHKLDADTVELYLSQDEFAELTALGAQLTVVERSQPLRSKFPKPAGDSALLRLPEGYSDLQEIVEFLRAIEAAYPDLAQVVDTTVFGPGYTYGGFVLPCIKISDNVTVHEDNEPSVLVNVCTTV